MKYIIYSIYNTISKKYYIGSTKQKWRLRKNYHVASLNKNKHHSFKLQSSWKRRGKEAFCFQIIEEGYGTREKRFERESFWISHFDSFKNGYNCTPFATCLNIERSKESKNKNSEALKKRLREGTFKNPNPKGQKRDKELMQRINSEKRIPILQFDLNDNFIKEWSSQTEASENLKLRKTAINNVLNNRSKTAGGFIWKYKNCEDIV